MAYDNVAHQRLIAERQTALNASVESNRLRGKLDPYSLMLAGKERDLSDQISAIREEQKGTQSQDLKDSAQQQANLDWCIQQALLTGKCLEGISENDGGVTSSAPCKAYRAAFTFKGALASHSRGYSAGIAAFPSLAYLHNPYSKPYASYAVSNSPLSPEAAFAAVPPFVVEGSRVSAGIGCPSGSLATPPGFKANATFTYGTDEAANIKGIEEANAAVKAAAAAASLSKENSDILINKMKTAIAKRDLNKKPIRAPVPRRPVVRGKIIRK